MVKIMCVAITTGKINKIGNYGIETDAKLPLSEQDIREIEKEIAEKEKCKNAVLLNYFKLGDGEDDRA